jgi:3-hydroxymyristoyl/3-hydroxydecanoyl-(acyl carrier protein) dehydratase
MAEVTAVPAPTTAGTGARFAAFSFVDRITASDAQGHARGVYTIPAGLPTFPASLVAEATGQLAAWIAMARVGFRRRPVAALAGETRFHATARPGETLDLAVDIEACDDESISYSGRASVDGRPVLELLDCLGPMLDVAEFDDPAALAADYALLTGAGAPSGRFQGVAPPPLVDAAHDAGRRLDATLAVPAAAPFFADHFPRRPVFPATLMLDAQLRLAQRVAAEAAAAPVRLARITNVKVRSFTPPGATLTLFAERVEGVAGTEVVVKVGAQVEGGEGRAVAAARMIFAPASEGNA